MKAPFRVKLGYDRGQSMQQKLALNFMCVVLVTHLFSGVGHMQVGVPDSAFRG